MNAFVEIHNEKLRSEKVYKKRMMPQIELTFSPSAVPSSPLSPFSPISANERLVNILERNCLKVFDHERKKEREPEEKDGLFFYFSKSLPWFHSNFLEIEKRKVVINNEINNEDYKAFRILVLLQMSSETREEFEVTLTRVHENLQSFSNEKCGEQDIGVVVIIDGFDKIHPSMLEFFNLQDKNLQIKNEKRMEFRKKIFHEKENPAFEKFPRDSLYCYQVSLIPEGSRDKNSSFALNTFLCVKMQSSGEINTLKWFFKGFCEFFQPDYCIVTKAGVRIASNSIFKIFTTFESNTQVGAINGYTSYSAEPVHDRLGLRIDEKVIERRDAISNFFSFLFDIQRAQTYENIFTQIIDKGFENSFGFQSKLDSNLFGLRWKAIKFDVIEQRKNIFDKEFIKTSVDWQSLRSQNCELDEICLYQCLLHMICLEIFTRKNYLVKYVPSIYSSVDVPKNLLDFMNEKRNILAQDILSDRILFKLGWKKILISDHFFLRKLWIIFLLIFKLFDNITNFLIPTIFISIFYYVCDEFTFEFQVSAVANTGDLTGFLLFVIIALLGGVFYHSLMNKANEKIEKFFIFSTMISTLFISFLAFISYLVIEILFRKKNLVNKSVNVFYTDELDILNITNKTINTFNPIALDLLNITYITYNDTINNFNQIVLGTFNQIVIYKADYMAYMLYANFIGLFLIVVINSGQKIIFEVVLNFLDYFFYFPVFKYLCFVYTICNIDEIKFDKYIGNQTPKLPANAKIREIFKNFKFNFILSWLLINMILTYILIIGFKNYQTKMIFLFIFVCYFTAGFLIKVIISMLNYLKFIIYDNLIFDLTTKHNRRSNYYSKTNLIKECLNLVKKDPNKVVRKQKETSNIIDASQSVK